MQTYWDLKEKDRAALTEDQLQEYLDKELMTKGQLKPAEPKLQEVNELKIAKKLLFVVRTKNELTPIGFETTEGAQAFIDLKPVAFNSTYDLGDRTEYPVPFDKMIRQEEYPSLEDLEAAKVELEREKLKRNSNKRILTEYHKAKEKVDEILIKIYKDRDDCLDMKRLVEKIEMTMVEYMFMAKDNKETAVNFLLKAFERHEVEMAEDWLDVHWVAVNKTEATEARF